MRSERGFAIAIDGPVAAGKGTIAVELAKQLHGFYLYTGAMYRSVALECIKRGLNLQDAKQVESVLPEVTISFDKEKVLLNSEDVTQRITAQDTANGASIVGVFPKVREELVRRQQTIARQMIENGQIVVAEGRDTGTKVFPDAHLKVYLTANDETRAKRRLAQFKEQGKIVDFATMLQDVRERDERDRNRETDPLPTHPEQLGYFIVDNSSMSEEQTIGMIKGELKKRGLIHD